MSRPRIPWRFSDLLARLENLNVAQAHLCDHESHEVLLSVLLRFVVSALRFRLHVNDLLPIEEALVAVNEHSCPTISVLEK